MHGFERVCVHFLFAMLQLDRSRGEERLVGGSDLREKQQRGNKVQRESSAGGSASPSGKRRDWALFSSNAERFERQR